VLKTVFAVALLETFRRNVERLISLAYLFVSFLFIDLIKKKSYWAIADCRSFVLSLSLSLSRNLNQSIESDKEKIASILFLN